MSRIDVVPADENKWKVLVNFIQQGIEYTAVALANLEAERLKEKFYPEAKLNLRKAA